MKFFSKGEITLGTIVAIVLLVIGFAIILFFLLLFNWGEEVDREVCHQSVIYRGTLPTLVDAKNYVPLKCKTAKYCISSRKDGECAEFKNSEDSQVVEVSDLEELERFIARDLLQCWSTMGEGKVSIFSDWLNSEFGVGSTYPNCVICSRIAFDKANLENAGIDLKKIDIKTYMLTHAAPGKEVSYAKYLAGDGVINVGLTGDFDMDRIVEGEEGLVLEDELDTIEVVPEGYVEEVGEDYIEPELAIMFMQISSPVYMDVLKNTLGIAGVGVGASFFTAPRLVARSAFSGPAFVAVGALAGVGLASQYYNVEGNREVTAGYCGDISSGTKAQKGCSVVVSTNYDASDVAQYCKRIESIA